MIKIKLNSFNAKSEDFPQYENERLSEIFDRFYKHQGLPEGKFEHYFKIYIDGEEIDKKLWAYIKPKAEANILIALVPKSGDTGRILGQIAVVVATIAV